MTRKGPPPPKATWGFTVSLEPTSPALLFPSRQPGPSISLGGDRKWGARPLSASLSTLLPTAHREASQTRPFLPRPHQEQVSPGNSLGAGALPLL